MKSTNTLYILLIIITFSACKVTEKRLHQGRYEEAISGAVAKLTRNSGKASQILVLEEAFRKANERDLDRVDYLNTEGQPGRWTEILNIYQRISRRQNKIQPLLPLYIEEQNRNAVFKLLDVKQAIAGAKENASNYLYTHAVQLLERENRYDAREAYGELLEIKQYYRDFRDVDEQLARAREMGTNEVLFRVINSSPKVIYRDLENNLNDVDLPVQSGKWFRYYNNETQSRSFDYEITVWLEWIETSPEKMSESRQEVTREVEDGWEYLKDKEGDFVKDSLGNKIKITKYKTLRAFINETHQTKAASIGGKIQYFDLKAKKIIHTEPLRADQYFENFVRTATGDLNALDKETKDNLGGRVLVFPPDHQMLMDAANTFKLILGNAMRNKEGLLEQ